MSGDGLSLEPAGRLDTIVTPPGGVEEMERVADRAGRAPAPWGQHSALSLPAWVSPWPSSWSPTDLYPVPRGSSDPAGPEQNRDSISANPQRD